MDIKIYTDGGSRGNPGPSAIGIVFIKDKNIIFRYNEYIGNTTNNIAEATAISKALQIAKDNIVIKWKNCEIILYTDSLLICNQILGLYKIKDSNLKTIHEKIKLLRRELNIKFVHIPREQNTLADSEVNKALG